MPESFVTSGLQMVSLFYIQQQHLTSTTGQKDNTTIPISANMAHVLFI